MISAGSFHLAHFPLIHDPAGTSEETFVRPSSALAPDTALLLTICDWVLQVPIAEIWCGVGLT